MARIKDIAELFDVDKVIRQKDRMGIWLKLLSLSHPESFMSGLSKNFEYTPGAGNSNFYFDLLMQQPKNYIEFTDRRITFTELGRQFIKDMFTKIEEKHRMVIHSAKAVKGSKMGSINNDHIIINATIGKKAAEYMIEACMCQGWGNDVRLFSELSARDPNTKDGFSRWSRAEFLKPFTLQLFNPLELVEKIKAALPEKEKMKLATFVLQTKVNIWRELL
jgi:hypothetical protein